MPRIVILLFLLLLIPACQKEADQQLGYIGYFPVGESARAIAIHPLTGDILTIHNYQEAKGDDIKIKQHRKDGEFVKTLVDFENIEQGMYDYYLPVDMTIDASHTLFALVNPVVYGVEYDSLIQTHFCILSFDLNGILQKEYIFPLEDWDNEPSDIACSDNYLYASDGKILRKINLSDGHLNNIQLPKIYSQNLDLTSDIECDQKGRILFSAPGHSETDSANTEVYVYDVNSGEIEHVIKSLTYPRQAYFWGYMSGISVDDNGQLYLVTTNAASLEIFNPEMNNLVSMEIPPIDECWRPAWDVATFGEDIYVLGIREVHVFRWE